MTAEAENKFMVAEYLVMFDRTLRKVILKKQN